MDRQFYGGTLATPTDQNLFPYKIDQELLQAQEPCHWFGAEQSCERWRIMAACAGTSAGLDLIVSLALALSGFSSDNADMSKHKLRCVFLQGR